jgi:hypothetical protein
MKRILFTAAAAAAVLAGSAAMAAPAMASNGPAQFITHAANHEDTTDLINPVPLDQQAVINDPTYGPVWAWDDLAVKLVPVPVSAPNGANYRVDITVTGSFHGFADPNTGAALDSNGPVKGTISYYVAASQAPDGAGLPAQEAGGIGGPGLRTMISQLFDGNETVVGGGDQYLFTYQNGNYWQDASGVHGDVRGH